MYVYIYNIYIQYITVYCAPMFTSSYKAIIAINGGSTLFKVSLFTLSLSHSLLTYLSIYVCIYILYMCICLCVCVFTYTYIIYTYIYIYIYIYSIYINYTMVLMKQNKYSHSNPECEKFSRS